MANVRERQARQPTSSPFWKRASLPPESHQNERRRAPTWLSVVLVALTCLSFVATTLVWWTEATLLNTDGFVALVEPLSRDPEVVDSVSEYVADEVVGALDIPGRTASALPANGQFLTGPLEQTVHDFVRTRTETLLTSDKMQTTWTTLERSLHANAVAALRGQPSTVAVTDGTLSVDLLPMIASTLRSLQEAAPAFIPTGPPIPQLSGAQSPAEERQLLSRALGVQLAPNFGVVTLLQSDALATAQRIVATLDVLRIVLPIVTLALALAAIWFAADRRRAWLWLGIGIAAPTLVGIALVSLLLSRTATVTAEAGPAQTITATLLGLVAENLLGLFVVILIVSALVALAAYLAGKPAWLARLRPGTTPRQTRETAS